MKKTSSDRDGASGEARATLKALHFQPLTSQEIIKSSVCEVTKARGLPDSRFGLPNQKGYCSFCGANRMDASNSFCPGHSGHLKLPVLVYHWDRIAALEGILNRVCFHCYSFKQKGRKKRVKTGQVVPDFDSDDVVFAEAAAEENSGDCLVCNGPAITVKKSFKKSSDGARSTIGVLLVLINDKVSEQDIPPAFQKLVLPDDMPPQWRSKFLDPNEALRILKCLPQETLAKLEEANFPIVSPEDFFVKSLFVPPNWMSITMNGRVFQDKTLKTLKLALGVIKSCMYTGDEDKVTKLTEQNVMEIQAAAAQCLRACPLYGNHAGDERPRHGKETKPLSGLQFLRNLSGKCCGASARAVVVGDPALDVDEIGVPAPVAAGLVVSETVTSFNLVALQAYANKCPGAKLFRDGEFCANRKLQVGDVIRRSLKDGDLVFVNRPPTFHKHALIGLKTKLLGSTVFAINPLICPPLFADFDGDMLALFLPQSVEVRAEVSELVALSKQLLSSQGGESIIGLTQDALLGAHLLSRLNVFLDKVDMDQLRMSCPTAAEVPVPAIVKSPTKGPLWTGKQLFQMTLPRTFDWESDDGELVIQQGEILETSDSTSAWLSKHGLVTRVCSKYGPEIALEHLTAAQRITTDWISERGFSVGLNDFYMAADAVSRSDFDEQIVWALEEAKAACLAQQILSDSGFQVKAVTQPGWQGCVPPVTSSKEAVQQTAISAFQSVMRNYEKTMEQHACKSNRENSLLRMVKANSKGSLVKMLQQAGCLGLQLLHGRFLYDRVKVLFPGVQESTDNPTSPELWKAMGLVESSFLEGLDPKEFFIHSISARKVSDNSQQSCYRYFKLLMCFMKDIRVEYDNTVRSTHKGHILQFTYDGIGADPGEPVGLLAATALIEPVYDQVLSSSPEASTTLKTLQNMLFSNAFKDIDRSVRLKLRKTRLQPEWTALQVQEHLRQIRLEMLTSRIWIEYSPCTEVAGHAKLVPWIGCFKLRSDVMERCDLNVDKIISCLRKRLPNLVDDPETSIQRLHIYSRNSEELCFFPITSMVNNDHKQHYESIKGAVMPLLLKQVVKGNSERIESVSVKWEEELCLEVTSTSKSRGLPWTSVLEACQPISHLVDWEKSAPLSVREVGHVFGIEAAYQYLVEKLKALVKGTGRAVKLEHLTLIASVACYAGYVNCFDTGAPKKPWNETGINETGYEAFLKNLSGCSPLAFALEKTPGAVFEAAAMKRAVDYLGGANESIFCGKRPALGTGVNFQLLYNDVDSASESVVDFESLLFTTKVADGMRRQDRERLWERVDQLAQKLQHVLKNSKLGSTVSHVHEAFILDALSFHPTMETKVGCGVHHIKVDKHCKFGGRCFHIVRLDRSIEDFSYHKCLLQKLRDDDVLVGRYKDKYMVRADSNLGCS